MRSLILAMSRRPRTNRRRVLEVGAPRAPIRLKVTLFILLGMVRSGH